MANKFKDIADMISSLTEDSSLKEQMLSGLEERKIATFLMELRCRHELTQKDIAQKMNVTQSKISKIECSADSDISVKDLVNYGNALDLNLEIGFRNKSTKKYDLIKYHYFKMKEYLNELLDLMGDDKDLQKGVLSGHIEALLNVTKGITENIERIPIFNEALENESDEKLHITPPLYEDKEGTKIKEKHLAPV